MQSPAQITYRNLDPSPFVETLVQRRIEALERLHPRIVGCEVVLDAPQKRKVSGRIVRVRVNVHIPGPDISTEGMASQGSAQADTRLAINRAFTAAEKQLKRHKKVMNAVEVKHHPPLLHGEVTLIEPDLGYGYLRADDGREVYFQRDSLTGDDWDRIEKGSRLRFREMSGEKGPFATGATLVAD